MEYAFNMFNKLAKTGLIVALQKFLENENRRLLEKPCRADKIL